MASTTKKLNRHQQKARSSQRRAERKRARRAVDVTHAAIQMIEGDVALARLAHEQDVDGPCLDEDHLAYTLAHLRHVVTMPSNLRIRWGRWRNTPIRA